MDPASLCLRRHSQGPCCLRLVTEARICLLVWVDTRIIMALAFDATLLTVCAYAALRGKGPERVGAAVNLCAVLATNVARLTGLATWLPTDALLWVIDLSVLASFFWLGIASTRFWPIWCFGFALADICLCVARMTMPDQRLFVYATGQGIWAYLALAALAVGSYRVSRDATSTGSRGWRSDERRSFALDNG